MTSGERQLGDVGKIQCAHTHANKKNNTVDCGKAVPACLTYFLSALNNIKKKFHGRKTNHVRRQLPKFRQTCLLLTNNLDKNNHIIAESFLICLSKLVGFYII